MLVAQLLLFLGIAKPGFGGRARVRDRFLPYASATHEDLRLKQFLALARLALHVVDGVAVFHVGVKSKDHWCPGIIFLESVNAPLDRLTLLGPAPNLECLPALRANY